MMLVRLPKEINRFLEVHRHEMDTPQCYLGTEPNTHKKDWNDPKIKLRVLLVPPWRYEDFRGNQTIPLLYQMLNDREDILCDRAFFPNTEKEYKLFLKYKYPIFGLETRHSMGEYDIIMTSLSFLPPWVNFPLMLDMSGIPSFWWDRKTYLSYRNGYPLIMVGGSSMYGNFSIAYPVVDIVYLGDAEPGLFPLLDALIQEKTLQAVQGEFNYVFCPSLHAPVYHEEQFVHWLTKEQGAYKKLKIIRQDKLDEAPALTRPIPSFTDTSMGLGEIEISRGCRAMCAFCGIGWKYRPYRERSKDNMVALMKENRRNSGALALCPIATEFAYYTEKQALIFELMKEAHGVDPLSMRIDAFIDDMDFDAQLAERGMNQLALGVEAPSQRLRNLLMKGISEQEILDACYIAIHKGFKRIKFFMISNIDEEWEDFEEFFSLLRKVRAIKAPFRKKTRTGWDIQIVCSWTPLFVEPCVPLQWKKPTIEQRKDWKRVDEILRGELKCKFKLGIKNAEDFLWTMQGMHLGDTRFSESLVRATLHLKRPFYVSFTKSMKKQLTKEFKRTGYEWKYLLRERKVGENFPWNIVDRGVRNSVLRKLYDDYKSKKLETVVKKVVVPTDRPDIDYKKHHKEIETIYWWLCRYDIDRRLEIIPNTHIKALVHRAAFQVDYPIAVNSMKFFSDRDARNWYGGVDYFAMSSREVVSPDELSKELPFDIHSRYLGTSPKRWTKYANEFMVAATVSADTVRACYEIMQSSPKVMVAIPSTRYFSGSFTKKKIDIVEEQVNYLIRNIEPVGGSCTFKVHLGQEIGIRFFLQALFPSVALSKILRWQVDKMNMKEAWLTESVDG